MKFRDHLPDDCPPEDAIPATKRLYRFIKGDTPKPRDFLSYRELHTDEAISPSECEVCCLSMDLEIEGLKKLANRYHHFKKKNIMGLDLIPEHGMIEPSPSEISNTHYSWWIYSEVDPVTIPATIHRLEEA